MTQEFIQSLLTLTGVSGIVLAGRRNRPYFWGIESILDSAKQILAQGVVQVLDNIPDQFDYFIFHFIENRVYVHKLGQGIVLIVIAQPDLEAQTYQQTISKIKQLVGNDPYNTVSTLKQLLGNKSRTVTQPNPVPVTPNYQLKDILIALNYLSTFSTQYLGKVVVANYWKSARPQTSWLSEFEIDRNAQLIHPKANTSECTEEQYQEIKEWVLTYIKRCKQVIRNFDKIIAQEGNENLKLIL